MNMNKGSIDNHSLKNSRLFINLKDPNSSVAVYESRKELSSSFVKKEMWLD